MPKTASEGPQLDDFLQAFWHQSFCFESVILKNGTTGVIAAGTSLLGRLFVKSGSDWLLVDAAGAAGIGAASVVGICLRTQRVIEDVAASGNFNDTANGDSNLLVRGPALVQKEDFEALLDAGVNKTNLETALNALDIRYVEETGLKYTKY